MKPTLISRTTATLSIGLTDRVGARLGFMDYALLKHIACDSASQMGDVYFHGEGQGTYTNSDGDKYQQPAFTVVVGIDDECYYDALASLVRIRIIEAIGKGTQESFALTWRGETHFHSLA